MRTGRHIKSKEIYAFHWYEKLDWKTVRPFFTDKGVNHDGILLVEENETISDNDEISEKLNNFFADVVKNLNMQNFVRV